jgi:hypothetical protein
MSGKFGVGGVAHLVDDEGGLRHVPGRDDEAKLLLQCIGVNAKVVIAGLYLTKVELEREVIGLLKAGVIDGGVRENAKGCKKLRYGLGVAG